jgi:transcription elongation factor
MSDDEIDSPPPPPEEDDGRNLCSSCYIFNLFMLMNSSCPIEGDVNSFAKKKNSSHIEDDESDDNDMRNSDGDDDDDENDNEDDDDGRIFGQDSDDEDEGDNDQEDEQKPDNRPKKRAYEEDDDDEDEDEEDDELALHRGKKKSKRSSRENKKGQRKAKRKKSGVARFFDEQADVADDSESESEDFTSPGERGEEIIQNKDILEAVQRVERRHESARERLNRSADELAREYELRAREELKYSSALPSRYRDDDGVGSVGPGRAAIANKQSLLPSISDPGIWRVKCTPGKEQLLVRSLMLKSIDHRNKTGVMRIKSAFTTSTRGMIYIEAMAEPFAKESVQGLYGFYVSSFARIPVQEMTSLFNVQFKKKPLTVGQWVRLRRGPLKNDLAQIVELLDGGMKAIIKAIPRPDYAGTYGSKNLQSTQGNLRPQQKLFDPEEVRSVTGQLPERQRFGSDREMYDFYGGDFYKEGFLFKEVNVATYIQSVDINPKLEELQMFLSKRGGSGKAGDQSSGAADEEKSRHRQDMEDEEDDDFIAPESDEEGNRQPRSSVKPKKQAAGATQSSQASISNTQSSTISSSNILQEIATQLKDTINLDSNPNLFVENESSKAMPYVLGDLVQVVTGELRNLVGKVIAINPVTKTIRIAPKNSIYRDDIDVELGNIVKYITPGAHVKVTSGQYTGQTGRVVAINVIDQEHIAAILTDATNTEIQCNLSHLQISDEVTTGLSALNGYELYDLVVLNENETATVIHVGAERLRVVNHTDTVKEVLPQELSGKRNTQSQRSSAFDAQQNTIKVGDTVNVTSGPHANRSGTIKHIMKGNLWLHSNAYLKNSGVFVIKGRACVLAGSSMGIASNSSKLYGRSAAYGANEMTFPTTANSLIRPTISTSKPPPGAKSGGGGGNFKGGKDPDIGKTIRIIRGSFKGLLGTIVDVTATHYSVELLARMKKIIIEREHTLIVGTKNGAIASTASTNPNYPDGSATPYIGASDTPRHMLAGSHTPRFGSETPSAHYGSETPGSRTPNVQSSDADIWRVGTYDSISTPAHAMGSGSGRGWDDQSNSGGWTNHSAPAATSYSPYNPSTASYTPTSAIYSPMTGSNSPGGASVTSTATDASKAAYLDWESGFIVILKRGEYGGRQAVLDGRPDAASGSVAARLRDGHGNIDYNKAAIILRGEEDAVLAEPPLQSKVFVFSGKKKGLRGILEVSSHCPAI